MKNSAAHRRRLAVVGGGEGWHQSKLVDASEKLGVSIDLFQYADLRASDRIFLGGLPIDQFDAVLTRTMPPGSLELVTIRLSMLHEAAKTTTVINSASSLELAIDKYRTSSTASRLNLPIPPTTVAQDRTTALQQFRQLGGDVVIKPIFGGEGRGVMRVQEIELARTIFTTLQTAGLVILQQAFIPPGGSDQRILIVGDFVQSVVRTNHREFRTNRSAGAEICAAPSDHHLVDQSRLLMSEMGLKIAAVDWIDSERGPLLLEVNAIPGWRSTQTVTDARIAEQMIVTVLEET